MISRIMKAIRSLEAFCKKGDAEHEDCFREEFEDEAFESGEFKGVRFTRTNDGKYADQRLEAHWKKWVGLKISDDMAI